MHTNGQREKPAPAKKAYPRHAIYISEMDDWSYLLTGSGGWKWRSDGHAVVQRPELLESLLDCYIVTWAYIRYGEAPSPKTCKSTKDTQLNTLSFFSNSPTTSSH